jgi:hypothetical protein
MSTAPLLTSVWHETPEVMRGVVRRHADRKVIRLLDDLGLAPVVTVARLREAWPADADLDRIGLLTISSFEPRLARNPGGADDPDQYVRDAVAYLQTASPMVWLKAMGNNPHCQAAIATGLRGPSLHLLGGAPELCRGLPVVGEWIETGAGGAIVVAFDWTDGIPAAAGLALGDDRGAVEGVTAELVARGHQGTATELLRSFIADREAAAPIAAGTP